MYMLHVLYKCVKIVTSFFPTSPFPQVAPCLSRARSGTPLIWGFHHMMATTLAASKNPMSKQKQPSGNTMSRRSRRMVPCIHPALLVPLLLGAGAILDKTISVPAACPTQIWYCSGFSWAKLNLPVYCFDVDKSLKPHC